MIYPNYVKQSPVLGLTSGAASGASLSYFTHVVAAPPGGGGDDSGSVSFDGNDYLSIADSADFNLGSGDFTIEAYVYANSFSSFDGIIGQWPQNGGNTANSFVFELVGGSVQFYYSVGSTIYGPINGGSLSTGTWHHVAAVRSGNTMYMFKDGVLYGGSGQSVTHTFNNPTSDVTIGGHIASAGYLNGKISNLRLVKGTALYTSNFTPPLSSLTSVTNTKLLCCQSTTSVTDADVTPGTITNNGATVSTSPFTGSVYFNSSSLRLTSTADLCPGTSDFTFECWLRPTNWSGSWMTVYQNGVYDGFYVGKDSSGNFVVRASSNTSFITQSTLPTVNQWTHIAVTRQGSTLRLFYNGVLKNSVSNSHNFPTAATAIAQTTTGGEGINGRISNLRFIKGTALYTSNFTAPTEKLTNVTNTKLLCCQTAVSVTTAAVTPSVITTNGSPQISTQSPFVAFDGGGSLYLDGSSVVKITSDSAAASIFNIGSGTAFTIEAWVYPTSLGTYNNIMSGWDSSCNYRGVLFHILNSGQIFFGGPGGSTHSSNASSPVTLNNWHHVAVTRNNGSSGKFFIDGVSAGTFSNNGEINNHGCGVFIGANMDGYADGSGGMYRWNGGYISNLRYVVGHETYTSSFTPSTEPLTETSQGVPSGACKFLACQDETSIDTNSISVPMTADYGTPVASGKNPFGAVSPGGGETSGSVLFDGNGDFLSLASSNDFDFGSGNFTIEGFFYKTTTTTLQTLLCSSGYYTSGNNGNWILRITNANDIAFATYDGTGNEEYTNFSASTSVNTWYHFALVREGTGTNQTKFYLNGALAGSMTVSKSLSDAGNNGLRIGEESVNGPGNNFMNGYLSNIRIIKGTALYTSNFTAPTSSLTNVTNTKLLCCQSAVTATDAAVTPGTITSNGDPQASSSTPFVTLPSSAVFYASGQDFTDRGSNAYTITKVGNGLTSGNSTSKSGGGSFRFDGSDAQQYFYAGSNTFLNDSLSSWQFQCWARYDSGNAGNVSGDMGMLVDQYVSGVSGRLLFGFQANSLVMRVNGGTVELTSGAILSNNTWHHVLLNWDGTTHRLFTDGILRDSSTTVPAVYTGKRTEFGGGGDLGGYNLHGYMEHILVENGGTVKTSNFTPNNSGFVT